MWPTNVRSFVPVQSQPAQVEEHAFTGSRTHSGSIKVFYSKHKLSICTTGKEPCKQGGAQITQVQVAGWAWRVPATNQRLHFSDHGQTNSWSFCLCPAITGYTLKSASKSTSTHRGRPTTLR